MAHGLVTLPDLPAITDRAADLLIGADPPTYQQAWELTQLRRLYQQRQPRRVLEIGTFYGGTLLHWLRDTAPGAVVVSVDLPQPGAWNPDRWQLWAADAGQTLLALGGDSGAADIIQAVTAHGPYDWIHIDADHSDTGVRRDWATYAPLVAPGGAIVLHDLNDRPGYGVAALWAEIARAGYLTQQINAGVAGLCGIGVVYA